MKIVTFLRFRAIVVMVIDGEIVKILQPRRFFGSMGQVEKCYQHGSAMSHMPTKSSYEPQIARSCAKMSKLIICPRLSQFGLIV